MRQLTDVGEDALDVIEDAWYGEPFTSGGKEYDGSPESVDTAMRDLWEDPDLCPTRATWSLRSDALPRSTRHRPSTRFSKQQSSRHPPS